MPRGTDGHQTPNYKPTPEEITAACAEVQKEWSPEETRRRMGIFRKDERERSSGIRTVSSPFPEPQD